MCAPLLSVPVTTAKLLNLSVPQFPNLVSGDNSTYLAKDWPKAMETQSQVHRGRWFSLAPGNTYISKLPPPYSILALPTTPPRQAHSRSKSQHLQPPSLYAHTWA